MYNVALSAKSVPIHVCKCMISIIAVIWRGRNTDSAHSDLKIHGHHNQITKFKECHCSKNLTFSMLNVLNHLDHFDASTRSSFAYHTTSQNSAKKDHSLLHHWHIYYPRIQCITYHSMSPQLIVYILKLFYLIRTVIIPGPTALWTISKVNTLCKFVISQPGYLSDSQE